MSEYLKNAKVIWQGSTKPVEFSYIDFGGNKTRRKVDVTHILYDPDTDVIYLQGHCHLKNAVRHFRVDNIETMLLIGSKRMYVEEWLSNLGIDDPRSCLEQQNVESTQNHFQDPEIQSLLKKVVENGGGTYKPNPPIQPARKVSPSLGLGIFFFPMIFAWFTLRKGHTTLARVLSFIWLAVILINVISGDNKTVAKNEYVGYTHEKSAPPIDLHSFNGLTDCQLALRVYNDYQPIFAELHQFVTNANNQTYQEVYRWKETTRLDARVAELDAKYPKSYPATMTNALFAKNLSFAIGQYWRDVHSSLRHTNNQGPIDSEQPSLMNDDLQLLKQNCPEEFKG